MWRKIQHGTPRLTEEYQRFNDWALPRVCRIGVKIPEDVLSGEEFMSLMYGLYDERTRLPEDNFFIVISALILKLVTWPFRMIWRWVKNG